MAIFSDGTTDVTIEFVDETIAPVLEKSVTTSAGGRLKTQTGGERLTFSIRFRTTAALFRSLMNLLKNGADEYYYTPEDTHQFYTTSNTVTFPLNVVFNQIAWEWDNRSTYYIGMQVTSVDYV
jgi:hypothetical protein